QVPPPKPVASGAEVASLVIVTAADAVGTVPFTQNDRPWYADASTQPIQRPIWAPHLLACVLDIPPAYLLPALPGPALLTIGDPAMLTIGDPVPSFDSKRPE